MWLHELDCERSMRCDCEKRNESVLLVDNSYKGRSFKAKHTESDVGELYFYIDNSIETILLIFECMF